MMYQPASRVLTVLELLQSRPGISGGEIARRLEVDRRTVRRYITTLQDLGVPVDGVRGRHGGYRLRPGFRLPPLMLTDDEAMAVSLGLLLSQQLGLSIDPESTDSASAKLARVLPIPLAEQAGAVREVVSLALPGATGTRVDSVLIGKLSKATGQRRRIELRYRAWQREESRREIDPYGLVYLMHRWYLVGYCRLRDDLRMFRLDRIEHCRTLDDRFEPPDGFDCLEFATHSLASMPGHWRVAVRLELPLAAARERIQPVHGSLEGDEGATIFRCTADDLDRLARLLIGLDCSFSVVEPDALRSRLRYLARRIEQFASDPAAD